MAHRWFDDFNDDFFSRPRLRLLHTDPWDSLEQIDDDFGGSDIFSDFATKAASLRHRVEQDRISRELPNKKNLSRRVSGASCGVASPTPSSINSASFNFETSTPQPQGKVTFPLSSCSNISQCSDNSIESICTEKSANRSAVSEQLSDGGEARSVESTQSWIDRNSSGGLVGEGASSEILKTETRPGSFQEYSKQECCYSDVGSSPAHTFHSVLSEERASQSSSPKALTSKTSKRITSSSVNSSIGGKPFRAPPNRSLFYDELDMSLGASVGRGARRRISPFDKLVGLVDQVVHHDNLFQTEIEQFLRDRPRSAHQSADISSTLPGSYVGTSDSMRTPYTAPFAPFIMKELDQGTRSDVQSKSIEDVHKENDALKEENSRLQQVLQEVTAVNKRWQRYNTDRRMYVQKLLATIQDLQEQMNERAESAITRPTPMTSSPQSNDSSTTAAAADVDRLKRQYEQQTQLLLLQIKSHKEDWEAEHRERCKILQDKNELEEEVIKLKNELDALKKVLSSCSCSEAPNKTIHIASQDFTPRTSYQTSFQVPYSSEEIRSSFTPEGSAHNTEKNQSDFSSDKFSWSSDAFDGAKGGKTSSDAHSLFLGYPHAGLATVIGFSSNSDRMNINSETSESHELSLTCPNCSRTFPQSRRICYIDHLEFCQGTDKTPYCKTEPS